MRRKRITKLKISLILSFIILVILVVIVYINSDRSGENVVATLNEKPIYKDELLEDISYIIGEDFDGNSLSDIPKEVLESIIIESKVSDRVYREALRNNIDEEEKIKRMIQSFKKYLIVDEFIKRISNEAVTDEQVLAKYKELVEILNGQEERKIKHILLDSEDEAERTIREIRRTGSFEKVAKRKSLDITTATEGGELGYVLKDQLVPEFGEVAFILKEGAISKPVKTTYGWHVIKVDDIREAQPAEFELVREQIRNSLVEQKRQEYLQGIASTLKVEILLDYTGKSVNEDVSGDINELGNDVLMNNGEDIGEVGSDIGIDDDLEEDEFELDESEVLNASEAKEEEL